MTTVYTGLPGTFTAYKLVACYENRDDRWCSLAAGGDAKVMYEVGQPAQAPAWLAVLGYFLTAFDTLEHVARWWDKLELHPLYAVFACEALYAEPLPPRATPWAIPKRAESVQAFPALYRGWPEGTIMVQRLILLVRVPEDTLRALVRA